MTMTATEPTHQTSTVSPISVMLRLEGLTVLMGSILAYTHLGGKGWLFALLLLAPDLSAFGLLVNKKVGTWSYNLAHLYTLPALLLALALIGGWTFGVQLALIWFAHIGLDRLFGYGLKYTLDFKDTHITRL